MKENLQFYYVNNDYLDYLRKIDSNVAYNKKNINIIKELKNYKFDKFYLGILLGIDNKYYLAPFNITNIINRDFWT